MLGHGHIVLTHGRPSAARNSDRTKCVERTQGKDGPGDDPRGTGMTAPRAPILMAIDQGSGSSRVLAFDRHGRVLAHATRPLATRTPRPGWVEHSPDDLLRGVKAALPPPGPRLGRAPGGRGR